MPTEINGLPAHVLLIHLVLAAVPLAALFVVLHAVWPAARRRLGIVTPLVALAALIMVPITTNAGQWFKDYLIDNKIASGDWKERIEKHANLGATMLILVILLFVIAAALWYLGRRFDYGFIPDRAPKADTSEDLPRHGGGSTATAVRTQPRASARATMPTWANGLLSAVAVVVAVINIVQLVRIGDSGAQAVWKGSIH